MHLPEIGFRMKFLEESTKREGLKENFSKYFHSGSALMFILDLNTLKSICLKESHQKKVFKSLYFRLIILEGASANLGRN